MTWIQTHTKMWKCTYANHKHIQVPVHACLLISAILPNYGVGFKSLILSTQLLLSYTLMLPLSNSY